MIILHRHLSYQDAKSIIDIFVEKYNNIYLAYIFKINLVYSGHGLVNIESPSCIRSISVSLYYRAILAQNHYITECFSASMGPYHFVVQNPLIIFALLGYRNVFN